MLSHAATATAKLMWLRYVQHMQLKDNEPPTTATAAIHRAVDIIHRRLPIAQLVYMVCIAYAFHLRVFHPHTTAGFIFKTTQYTTGHRYDAIATRIERLLCIR